MLRRDVPLSAPASTRLSGNACWPGSRRRRRKCGATLRSQTSGESRSSHSPLTACTKASESERSLRSFWYLKLRALIALRDWDALDAFARSKKSPIGYEPWVDELIRAGAQRQAVRFVERCDPRNRVELFIKCGEWVMAGQECARKGERGRLQ